MTRFPARTSLALVLACALAQGACGDLFYDPDAGTTLPITFAFAATARAGGAASAFDKADRIGIRLLDGGTTVIDTTLAFSAAGAETRVRLGIGSDLLGRSFTLRVELRRAPDALFTGTGQVTVSSDGQAVTEVTLSPVIAGIALPTSLPPIQTIGATTQLTAAATFATGDTVPDATITWRGLDPGIVTVTSDGRATANAEGTARVVATAGTFSANATIEVRLAAASITVAPATATIFIGTTQQLTATLRDANGTTISRQPVWTSSAASVATVSSTGLVTGVARGDATITATADGVSATAQITVSDTPPPAAPSNLAATVAGAVVTLTWRDNSSDETRFEVRRGTGAQLASIATLPANTSRYVDQTAPADQTLTYDVQACNATGCSSSQTTTVSTVPAPPANLTGSITDTLSLMFVLDWTDASSTETLFLVQYRDSASLQWLDYAQLPANTTTFQDRGIAGRTESYRVLACNAAGCSNPSNQVDLTFGTPLPIVITQSSTAAGDMRGSITAFGQPFDYWFEWSTSPSFFSFFSTNPIFRTSDGTFHEIISDLTVDSEYFYRIVALTSFGLVEGDIVQMDVPPINYASPFSVTVCNGSASGSGSPQPCPVNPPSTTILAEVRGPLGGASPYSAVQFYLDSSTLIGSGTPSFVDDASGGVRIWTYAFTWTPTGVNPQTYVIEAVGVSAVGALVHPGSVIVTVDID